MKTTRNRQSVLPKQDIEVQRADVTDRLRGVTFLTELENILSGSSSISPSTLEVFKQVIPGFPRDLYSLPAIYTLKERRQGLHKQANSLLAHLKLAFGNGRALADEKEVITKLGSILVKIQEQSSKDLLRMSLPAGVPPSRATYNRSNIIAHASAIIVALEEALDFDPVRHHNNPPPALRIEDKGYLENIRNLVDELRQLNALLNSAHAKRAQTRRAASHLSHNLQKFLDNYIPMLAKGTACLTVAAMAGLLIQLGVDAPIVEKVLTAIRLAR